jgi:membrane associated rhomboid family serine protease
VLLPIGHEDLRGRRWPIVTIVIIALDVAVFLGTHWRMDEELGKIADLRVATLVIAASHPDVQLTPSQHRVVDTIRAQSPGLLEQIAKEDPSSVFEVENRRASDEQAQKAATALGQELDKLEKESVVERFAYFPYKSNPISLITADFLHGGWLHLIGNMWFLWLAGTVLEDVWGRGIYAVFYILAGIAALLLQGAMTHNTLGGTLGASGAIAGAMGAFLVRFPKTKIRFMFVFFLGFRFLRWKFSAPAYAMLPLWFAEQLIWALIPSAFGVAYWAHVGGFAFGIAVALGMKYSGAEHKMNQAIEEKVSWSADPRIEKASDALDQGRTDEAVALLKGLLAEKPDTLEAHQMLLQAYWKKQDAQSAQAEAAAMCKINIKARENELAWANYEEFLNLGGTKLPSTEWMALCRHLEAQQNWQRAALEYENVARAYSAERISVYALVSAARIQRKQLNNTAEAARLYREANESPLPHLDWDAAIRKGLAECGAAVPALAEVKAPAEVKTPVAGATAISPTATPASPTSVPASGAPIEIVRY